MTNPTNPDGKMCPVAAAVLEPQASVPAAAETPLCSDLTLLPLRHLANGGAEAEAAPWMAASEWPHWVAEVQVRVTPPRWEHVKRVALLAAQIAYAAGLDTRRAYAAGILHDLARDLDPAELLRLAPPECELDAESPLAVHGRAARALLETLGFTDPTVLEAVEDHVTGPKPKHRGIAACVYVADVSEPARGVNDDIRAQAFHDLPAALREAIVSKVTYLQGRGLAVHPRTAQLYQWLQAEHPQPENPKTRNAETERSA